MRVKDVLGWVLVVVLWSGAMLFLAVAQMEGW